MFIAPPYVYDYQAYPAVDVADRPLLNKLHLAEALGHHCGPTGVSPGIDGKYCLRPMNSVRGLGAGGFFEHDLTVATPLPFVPGYFWCEWFDGDHILTHYVNDVAVHSSRSKVTGGALRTVGSTKFGTLTDVVALPAFLQAKSRYVMVESIEDKIIDVAFRLAGGNARQEFIDDYKAIDAAYDPQDVTHGNSDHEQEAYVKTLEDGSTITGLKWNASGNLNRRPYDV